MKRVVYIKYCVDYQFVVNLNNILGKLTVVLVVKCINK